MTWIKLDDGFLDHPKIVRAGEPAAFLYIAGLLYCSRHLTDGVIPKRVVWKLTERDDTDVLAAALEREQLWIDEDDSWRVWQYTDYQRLRSDVMRSRERGKDRAKRSRERAANVRGSFAKRSRDIEVELEEELKPSPASSRKASADLSAEFGAWWETYPRKIDKGAAREAYARVRKTATAEDLLLAAKHYAAARAGEDPKFTKAPTTFLNKDRWSEWVAGNPEGTARSVRDEFPYYDPATGLPWGTEVPSEAARSSQDRSDRGDGYRTPDPATGTLRDETS